MTLPYPTPPLTAVQVSAALQAAIEGMPIMSTNETGVTLTLALTLTLTLNLTLTLTLTLTLALTLTLTLT